MVNWIMKVDGKKTIEVYSKSTVVVIEEQFGHQAMTSCPGSELADKNFRDFGMTGKFWSGWRD